MPPNKSVKSASFRKQPYPPTHGKLLQRQNTWSDDLKEMAPSLRPSPRDEQLLADEDNAVEFQHIDVHANQRGLFIFGVMQSGQTICVQVTGFERFSGDELDNPSRFMVDKQILTLSWLEVPARSFTNVEAFKRHSTCQYEISTCHTEITAHRREGAWAAMAPLRVLSFDIETMVPPDNSFPNPGNAADSVIQIATMVSILGSNDFLNPATRIIYTLGECEQSELNAEHRVFKTELALIQAWFDLVAELDVDIITGYNILTFDIPFMICRMNRRGRNLKDLPGRIPSDRPPSWKWSTMMTPSTSPPPMIVGRPVLDIFRYMHLTNRFTGIPNGRTNLDAAATKFLGITKEGVSFREISGLQRKSNETRTKLALYCLKDTVIPLGLFGCLDVLSPSSSALILQYRPLHLLFHAIPKQRIDASTIHDYWRPS